MANKVYTFISSLYETNFRHIYVVKLGKIYDILICFDLFCTAPSRVETTRERTAYYMSVLKHKTHATYGYIDLF